MRGKRQGSEDTSRAQYISVVTSWCKFESKIQTIRLSPDIEIEEAVYKNSFLQRLLLFLCPACSYAYIIPGIPPPAGIGGTGSLIVPTTDSVVRSVEATDVAF